MSRPVTFHAAVDRYSEWSLIGSGGTAHVYRVHDKDLGIPLAIKILRREFCMDAAQIAAIRQEVLISRALRHPNICPIHDLYDGPEGVGVIMDLLQGCELKTWITTHRGRLLDTLADRVTVFRAISGALSLAHRHIVHRDLKPSNIFLVDGQIGQPLIMDFGLSSLGAQTSSAFVGGTPKYMAPEQFLAPATVDARADLFSLGVTAYELLTDGRIPESSLQHLVQTGVVPNRLGSSLTPPSRFCDAIPPALDRLVLQLVQSDPASRPVSADEVCRTLDAIELAQPATRRIPVGAGATTPSVTIPPGAYPVILRRPGKPAAWQRSIRLSGLRLGVHAVTNVEYRAFLAATGYRQPSLLEHDHFGHPHAPVVGVSWTDASAYAAWAGGRLPTEVEWEIAASAGDADADYPWGSSAPDTMQANIDRVCTHTTAVGCYPNGRNAWGLWDMCGNVWEWCADPWDETLFRRLQDGDSDPIGTGDGAFRSIRGGSFDSLATTGRCRFRAKERALETRADIGFRIAFEGADGA